MVALPELLQSGLFEMVKRGEMATWTNVLNHESNGRGINYCSLLRVSADHDIFWSPMAPYKKPTGAEQDSESL